MNLKISAERGDGMLNYLEQGMILYVMAAVCVIGVISRFAANRENIILMLPEEPKIIWQRQRTSSCSR